MNIFNRYFLPALGWVILTTVLLVIPGDDLPGPGLFDIPHFDKLVHIGLFGMMALLICGWQFKKGFPEGKKLQYFIACGIFCLLYGIAMEFVQKYFIPKRSFDMTDILADGGGSLLGTVFSLWAYRKK